MFFDIQKYKEQGLPVPRRRFADAVQVRTARLARVATDGDGWPGRRGCDGKKGRMGGRGRIDAGLRLCRVPHQPRAQCPGRRHLGLSDRRGRRLGARPVGRRPGQSILSRLRSHAPLPLHRSWRRQRGERVPDRPGIGAADLSQPGHHRRPQPGAFDARSDQSLHGGRQPYRRRRREVGHRQPADPRRRTAGRASRRTWSAIRPAGARPAGGTRP